MGVSWSRSSRSGSESALSNEKLLLIDSVLGFGFGFFCLGSEDSVELKVPAKASVDGVRSRRLFSNTLTNCSCLFFVSLSESVGDGGDLEILGYSFDSSSLSRSSNL